MQGVDSCRLDDLRDGVADAVEDILVPLHRRTRRQERCKRLDGCEPLDAVRWGAIDACNCSKTSLHITIAGSLSTPGTAEDIRLTIDDTDNGIVIGISRVHPVNLLLRRRSRLVAPSNFFSGNVV